MGHNPNTMTQERNIYNMTADEKQTKINEIRSNDISGNKNKFTVT